MSVPVPQFLREPPRPLYAPDDYRELAAYLLDVHMPAETLGAVRAAFGPLSPSFRQNLTAVLREHPGLLAERPHGTVAVAMPRTIDSIPWEIAYRAHRPYSFALDVLLAALDGRELREGAPPADWHRVDAEFAGYTFPDPACEPLSTPQAIPEPSGENVDAPALPEPLQGISERLAALRVANKGKAITALQGWRVAQRWEPELMTNMQDLELKYAAVAKGLKRSHGTVKNTVSGATAQGNNAADDPSKLIERVDELLAIKTAYVAPSV